MEDLLQDRIDDFLRGRMSPEERFSFTQELRQDTFLEGEFRITKEISDGIADRARKKELIKTWKKKPNKNMQIATIVTSVAAIIAVGFFLADFVMPLGIRPSEIESPQGGSTYAYGKILQKLSEKDYETALKYIDAYSSPMKYDALSSEEPTEEVAYETDMYELLWLKSQALIGLDRIDEAIVVLETISVEEGKHQQDIDSLLNELQKTF